MLSTSNESVPEMVIEKKLEMMDSEPLYALMLESTLKKKLCDAGSSPEWAAITLHD